MFYLATEPSDDAILHAWVVEDSDQLPDALRTECERMGFEAKPGESVLNHDGRRWVLAVGLGDASGDAPRRAGAAITERAVALRAERAAVTMSPSSVDLACKLIEGIGLSSYRFDRYRSQNDSRAIDGPSNVELIAGEASGVVAQALTAAAASCRAVCLARDLANERPGVCTPAWLAEQAKTLASETGMDITVLEEEELRNRGFNLILAVGKGSHERPRLIHLVYRGEGEITSKLAVVGKGVTYDSGGYSIKTPPHQVDMHLDMGGAAATLGAASLVAATRPAGVEVHFLVPTVENMVSGNAVKVNEIVRGYGGRTVEIMDTDAEGRLILADALALAAELKVDAVLDLATLTGACVVALGNETAGLWSNRNELSEQLVQAAEAVAERVWPMPLADPVRAQLKSEFADTKNLGDRWGGAISAAIFLEGFVGDTPWAHLDIAGPGMMPKRDGWISRGGTGFGVLTVARWVADYTR